MNKNTGIVIGVIALLIIVGGVYASMNSNDEAIMEKEDTVVVQKEAIEKNDTMMKDGSYEAYSPEKLARAETGDVVLFFHASWCPSCRGLNSDIEANLSSIPEGISILKTDYDTSTELKKKYGVTYQHTLVQVDKDGNMIKKWSGGSKLSNLLSQIQ
jgi:thiol-disulfide isomerase/thioredoxin